MNNFISNGTSLQAIAPAGGVVGGQLYKQGGLIGVAVTSAAEGQLFTVKLAGEYSDLKKKAGEAWAIGDKLYLNTSGELEKTAANGEFAGYASTVALSAATTGTAILK